MTSQADIDRFDALFHEPKTQQLCVRRLNAIEHAATPDAGPDVSTDALQEALFAEAAPFSSREGWKYLTRQKQSNANPAERACADQLLRYAVARAQGLEAIEASEADFIEDEYPLAPPPYMQLVLAGIIIVGYPILWFNRRRFSRPTRWAIGLLGVVLICCGALLIGSIALVILINRLP